MLCAAEALRREARPDRSLRGRAFRHAESCQRRLCFACRRPYRHHAEKIGKARVSE